MSEKELLKVIAILLGVLASLAVFTALYFVRGVVLPFAIALLGAFAAEPLVRRLEESYRVPRWASGLLLVATVFMGVQLTVTIVADAIGQFQGRLPLYLATLQQLVDGLPLPAEVRSTLRVEEPEFWTEMLPVRALVGSVGSWAGTVTSLVANTAMVLVILVAMLIARKRLDERLGLAAGRATGRMETSTAVIAAIDEGIQRYMLIKTALSVALGLTFGTVLALLEVDFAVLWGFLAFLLNFIPTVGPVVATTPAVAMIWLQYGADQPGRALVSTLVIVSVQFVFANVIEPKIFGERLNLNFFAILFALFLWAFLWGVPGAVLSVPIMMAISLICREVPVLRPIHILLRA